MNVVFIRELGLQNYLECWQAMQQFTNQRNPETPDEIWALEHSPVFTQGQNGKPEHILDPGSIPVIKVDRGGQVTYHGPGQLVLYPLIDLKRKQLNIRQFVTLLEASVVHLLKQYHLAATTQRTAPGVYLHHKKICSIGLRVRRGCSFHGLALNLQMDLTPFSRINPCGFSQLEMTQLSEHIPLINKKNITQQLVDYLTKELGYTHSSLKK